MSHTGCAESDVTSNPAAARASRSPSYADRPASDLPSDASSDPYGLFAARSFPALSSRLAGAEPSSIRADSASARRSSPGYLGSLPSVDLEPPGITDDGSSLTNGLVVLNRFVHRSRMCSSVRRRTNLSMSSRFSLTALCALDSVCRSLRLSRATSTCSPNPSRCLKDASSRSDCAVHPCSHRFSKPLALLAGVTLHLGLGPTLPGSRLPSSPARSWSAIPGIVL